jgi:hypothetical protein
MQSGQATPLQQQAIFVGPAVPTARAPPFLMLALCPFALLRVLFRINSRISGLVVEYVVAIDVTRVRFPADALHYQTKDLLRCS